MHQIWKLTLRDVERSLCGAAVRVPKTSKPFEKQGEFLYWPDCSSLATKPCSFLWWELCRNVLQRLVKNDEAEVASMSKKSYFN